MRTFTLHFGKTRMPFVLSACLFATLAGAPGARAEIRPLPSEDCAALARSFSTATGFDIAVTKAAPLAGSPQASVIEAGPAGTACLMAGKSAGLDKPFSDVEARTAAVLSGWTSVPEQAADGPDDTMQGFAKGSRHVVFSLTREPPAGTCENVVQAACTVPPPRWTWTFHATAYVQDR